MILLDGGTGVLGTEVCRLLAARGESVRVLTRDPARAAHRDPAQPERDPAQPERDASRPVRDEEQPARTWTILRPAAYLETWLMVAGGLLLDGKPATILGRGRNPINFVAARDVARVVERAAPTTELHGQILDLTGPADLTLRELAATMATAIGCPLAVRRVPLPVTRVSSRLLRLLRPDAGRLIRAGVITDTTNMTAGDGTGTVCSRANNTRILKHSVNPAFPIKLIQFTAATEIAIALAATHQKQRGNPTGENNAEKLARSGTFCPRRRPIGSPARAGQGSPWH